MEQFGILWNNVEYYGTIWNIEYYGVIWNIIVNQILIPGNRYKNPEVVPNHHIGSIHELCREPQSSLVRLNVIGLHTMNDIHIQVLSSLCGVVKSQINHMVTLNHCRVLSSGYCPGILESYGYIGSPTDNTIVLTSYQNINTDSLHQ